jgi:uncharacterized membrane protein
MPLPASTSKYLFWVLNALLAVTFVAELFAPKSHGPLDAALLVLAAVTSMLALARQLPLQNVLGVAAIAALIGGLAHGLSSNPNVSLPFGPIVFNTVLGAKISGSLPWTLPLLWVFVIFNARGVARLILRPWRKVKKYGYLLIALTTLLAVAFDLALEPFAGPVKHFWNWQPTKISLTWQGATPLNFLGWLCVALLIMMLVTPSLIRKQTGGPTAPDFHPLILWLGALLLFAVGFACAGLWIALAVDSVLAAVTALLAVRGAKW